MKFPEWYRKNRALIVSAANLLFFWKKGQKVILALLAAFDAVLLSRPYSGASVLDENIRLGDIIVNEKG